MDDSFYLWDKGTGRLAQKTETRSLSSRNKPRTETTETTEWKPPVQRTFDRKRELTCVAERLIKKLDLNEQSEFDLLDSETRNSIILAFVQARLHKEEMEKYGYNEPQPITDLMEKEPKKQEDTSIKFTGRLLDLYQKENSVDTLYVCSVMAQTMNDAIGVSEQKRAVNGIDDVLTMLNHKNIFFTARGSSDLSPVDGMNIIKTYFINEADTAKIDMDEKTSATVDAAAGETSKYILTNICDFSTPRFGTDNNPKSYLFKLWTVSYMAKQAHKMVQNVNVKKAIECLVSILGKNLMSPSMLRYNAEKMMSGNTGYMKEKLQNLHKQLQKS